MKFCKRLKYAALYLFLVPATAFFASSCGLFGDLDEFEPDETENGGDNDGDNDGTNAGEVELSIDVESSWQQIVTVIDNHNVEVTTEVTIDILCEPDECDLVECSFTVSGIVTDYEDCETQIVEELDQNTEWEFAVTAQLDDVTEEAGTSGRVSVDPFVSRWDTGGSGSLELPLVEDGNYDFFVQWTEEGDIEHITGPDATAFDFTEPNTVSIWGTIEGWSFRSSDNAADPDQILSVRSWGPLKLRDSPAGHFEGASNLGIEAEDVPDLSGTTSLAHSFDGTGNLHFIGKVADWDVSHITDMTAVFRESAFNGDIASWDVSSVTNMQQMFQDAGNFDQDIGGWDVSSVTNMSALFGGASSFDLNLADWDITSVAHMNDMFLGSNLTDTNYEAMLLAWSDLEVAQNVEFNAGNARPSDPSAIAARDKLVSDFCWRIRDGDVVGDDAHEEPNCS